jgi:Predicted redox protein, regulator of disulfide bond formation
MDSLSINLEWKLDNDVFSPGKYSTYHTIKINDKININADSASSYGGNVDNMNPEQSLAASLSSCHMMTFLALASKFKWPVKNYKDKAIAHLGKNSDGKMSVTKIELNPQVLFSDDFKVSEDDMSKMQDRSHRYCFIANSLSKEVEIMINL